MQHGGDVPRLGYEGIGDAGKRVGRRGQDPKPRIQALWLVTGGLLQAPSELLYEPSRYRRGLRVRSVTKVKAAHRAHLAGGSQTTQETVSLQQDHPGARPPGGGRSRHARRASANHEDVAGNAGADAAAHFNHFRMCAP